MIAEINRLGQELVGYDLIVYRGHHHDADQWGLDDADDGRNVIYKQTRHDKNYDRLDATINKLGGDGYVSGLGLNHDVIIFVFTMLYEWPNDQPPGMEYCVSPFLHEWNEKNNIGDENDVVVEDWALTSDDCERDGYKILGGLLESIALHELGHFVGLDHINDPNAVMYPVANGRIAFTDNDKRAFCCQHECITDAFECDWSLVKQTFPAPETVE